MADFLGSDLYNEEMEGWFKDLVKKGSSALASIDPTSKRGQDNWAQVDPTWKGAKYGGISRAIIGYTVQTITCGAVPADAVDIGLRATGAINAAYIHSKAKSTPKKSPVIKNIPQIKIPVSKKPTIKLSNPRSGNTKVLSAKIQTVQPQSKGSGGGALAGAGLLAALLLL